MAVSKALVVGISGVSSCGKTTLSRLLRDVFPRTFILHQDDFYKPDDQIPLNDGVPDWDCIESIDVRAFEEALIHIRQHGTSPPHLTSKEDQNSVGEVKIDRSVVEDLKETASKRWSSEAPPIAIIDGFLLYTEGMKAVRDKFDVKLFLRTDYKTAKARREARTGYVTLDGFWEDPPGYVDKVVWPNYVKDHAFLFKDGNVEGELDGQALKRLNIHPMPDNAQGNMSACLHWAYEVLTNALSRYTEPKT